MYGLTETLPVACHLIHLVPVGMGAVTIPVCFTTATEAERVAADLAGYLDLDQPTRPEWWVQVRPETHAHQWCPVIPASNGGQ